MATSGARKSRQKTRKKSGPGVWAARYSFVLLSIALLASAIFLMYQGITGTAAFVGTGTSFTHEITSNKALLINQGRVPYSADQHLLTALGFLLVIAIAPIYIGRSLRSQFVIYSIGCALEALLLAAMIVTLSVWAATGHRFSNYLPLKYPESYVTPIVIAAVGLIVFAAAAIWFARIARAAKAGRPAVRLWG